MNATPFLDCLPVLSKPSGSVILEQGSPAGALYFLKGGSVAIDRDGVRLTEIHTPGAVLGEMSFLLDSPLTATVRVIESAEFYVAKDVDAFLQDHPEALLYISRLLARRLNAMSAYLVEIKTQFKDQTDHFGMIDEILRKLMNQQPRDIPPREPPSETNPPLPGDERT
jgi:CRP-like cAMP-binding protein